MDLAKRFSLGYLVSGSRNQSSSGGEAISPMGTNEMQQAVQAFVSPVLRELDNSANKAKPLFQIFDAVQSSLPGTDIGGFRDVIKWIAKTNLVKVIQADPHGNDSIQKA